MGDFHIFYEGTSEFIEEDFIDGYSIDELCKALKYDNIPVDPCNLSGLNTLLEDPKLCHKIHKNLISKYPYHTNPYHRFPFDKTFLPNYTSDYLKKLHANYQYLPDDIQILHNNWECFSSRTNLIVLNRMLLVTYYDKKAPVRFLEKTLTSKYGNTHEILLKNALKEYKGIKKKKYDNQRIIEELNKVTENQFRELFEFGKITSYKINLYESEVKKAFFKIFAEEIKNGIFLGHDFTNDIISVAGLHNILPYSVMIEKEEEHNGEIVIHKSSKMIPNNIYDEILLNAKFDDTFLIIGETGTGKELIAHTLHNLSSRASKPFGEINCAAIPSKLLEGELFGSEKGAFTDSTKNKPGLIEIANEGTFFLDEIGKMPQNLQAKLLKVVEEQKLYRVGSVTPIELNIRFIAAVQPQNIIKEDVLPDLIYRFGYPDCIKLPTLNEVLSKDGDRIINKVLNYLSIKLKLQGNNFMILTDAMDLLLSHEYKGNYRELENILKYALKRVELNKVHFSSITSKQLDIINNIDKPHLNCNSLIRGSNLEEIQLSEICKVVDKCHKKEKARIVEKRVLLALEKYSNIKEAVNAEGPKYKYPTVMKELKTAMGKGVGSLKKN